MRGQYEARWLSKQRYQELRKRGRLGDVQLLDTYNGFIIVQPAGSDLGDGALLTATEADYELQPTWFLGPLSDLKQARSRLGLEPVAASGLAETTF